MDAIEVKLTNAREQPEPLIFLIRTRDKIQNPFDQLDKKTLHQQADP